MHEEQKTCAQHCLEAAETDTMAFPLIVERLIAAGFESYAVDFRRSTAIYYLPGGDSISLAMTIEATTIAPVFDAAALTSAIRDPRSAVAGAQL